MSANARLFFIPLFNIFQKPGTVALIGALTIGVMLNVDVFKSDFLLQHVMRPSKHTNLMLKDFTWTPLKVPGTVVGTLRDGTFRKGAHFEKDII